MKIGKVKKNIQKITYKKLAGYFFLRTFAPLQHRAIIVYYCD